MGNNNIYLNFTIRQVKDVDNLVSIIESNGNFLIQDYNRFVRHAERSNQPSRILRRLKSKIFPFIGNTLDISKKIKTRENSINDDFWEKDYYASDFKLNNGSISIGKYILKSVRIKKTHSSWLNNIEHIFHISPVYNGEKQMCQFEFHFEPYTDLSLLLNEIHKKKEDEYKKQVFAKIDKKWNKLLYEFLLVDKPIYDHYKNIFIEELKKIGIHLNTNSIKIGRAHV